MNMDFFEHDEAEVLAHVAPEPAEDAVTTRAGAYPDLRVVLERHYHAGRLVGMTGWNRRHGYIVSVENLQWKKERVGDTTPGRGTAVSLVVEDDRYRYEVYKTVERLLDEMR
jgi:hypothetical protein